MAWKRVAASSENATVGLRLRRGNRHSELEELTPMNCLVINNLIAKSGSKCISCPARVFISMLLPKALNAMVG
jgi:hypothetical protein